MESPFRPADEQDRLSRLRDLGVLDRPQDEPDFDAIVELAASLCGTRTALLTLVDDNHLLLKAARGWDGPRTVPRDQGFSGLVVMEGRVVEIEDMRKDPRFSDHHFVLGPPYIGFSAGVPLLTRDGLVIGALCVADGSPRQLTGEQRRGLDRLASLAMHLVELRLAGQRIEESERRFRELADDAPVMIWMSSTKPDESEFFNRKWREFTGLDPVRPLSLSPLVHPDDLPALLRDIENGGLTAANLTTVCRMRTAAGEYRWVRIESLPRHGLDGTTIIGRIGITLDIHDETVARAELEAAEERQRLIIAATDDAPWDWDVARDTVYYSPEWWQMIGYEPDELPLTTDLWLKLAHPDDRQRIKQLNDMVMASPYLTSRFEMRLKHKQGHYVPVESRAYIQRDEKGRVLRISGINSDLTARKQMEQDRSQALELLREVSARVPGVMYQFRLRPDGSSCFPYASSAIRDIYEVDPQDVVADASSVFDILHPDDFDAVSASIAESARTLKPWSQEYRVRYRDGRVRWLQGDAMPQREPDGSILWHGFITDCSARKQAEIEHRQLAEQLRESQKMEAVGTLAGGIAHDFNNIAAAILGNTELARQDSQSNPEALRSLEQIQLAAERARDLTRQILTFIRRQPTERKLLDLGPRVEQVIRLLRSTLLGPLTVDCRLAPDVPPVLADSVQVEQVLMNLINNAAQALEGKAGQIAVQLDQHEGQARIRVSDTGSGIESDALPRIFEPFFTTKPVGQGTGLGLSVAYGIMQTHGGTIDVDTRPGEGSVFTLLFPAAERPARKGPGGSSPATGMAAGSG
ncbi:MAG: hypothetical protein RLZZ200_2138, partial [Pseudomonadota bacterium]